MLKNFVFIVFLLTIFIVSLVCYLYFNVFSGDFSNNQSDWAGFGSYIGGTVGGLFSSLSFLALIYTIYLQREELIIAIDSLKDSVSSQRRQVENYESQKFETTFYSLLSLHNQSVRELVYKNNEFEGCLSNLDTFLYDKDIDSYIKSRQEHILGNIELSQYFRVLYQLLKFIAKNNVKNKNKCFSISYLENRETIKEYENEEKMYASLVRSFVPVKMLPVLAINCIPIYGGLNNLNKYWALLERFDFLEHLRLDQLPLNLSKFIVLDRYSNAMGKKGDIAENVKDLKSRFPQYFQDSLTEGGYLDVYANDL